ncbi:MAG: Hsp20/alpha crystallin family protein [Pirellulaceae bacterium]|nr:Hsp20/alpha crystallin family protein [Pirellulaceae bacterium]
MLVKRMDPLHSELNWLKDEMQRVFGPEISSRRPSLAPAISMWEAEDAYYVEIELPGMKEKDVTIELSDENVLTVKGERVCPPDRIDKWILNHGRYGRFEREFKLTRAIDSDGILAHLEDGLLQVALTKREKQVNQKIQIN